ncbi:MAG: ABC transporter permease subunit [Hyphomicrobiales bacterium]
MRLGHDYVRTARAKGASPLCSTNHALRNALLPLVAVGGLQVGTLIAYTLLTETVFQWPGMGFLFLEAVTRADIPLITTYLVLVGLPFVITNTLVDVISLLPDPRVSLEERGERWASQTLSRTLTGFAIERPGATFAALLLGIVAIAALFAPLITPHDPFDLASFDVLDAELPPIWQDGSDPRFILGTDAQGRDLFSGILYGTRISLLVGILAVCIQAAIGVPLGLVAGYFGGRADTIVTRLADIQLSLSTLMMAIIVMALFRAGLGGEALSRFAVPLLVLVIGLAEWPVFGRTARAATLVEGAKDYVRAARALGSSDGIIISRHILPNILSPLVVIATTQVAGAIMAEAALSFLGLGMPVTKPSLGTLIRSGYDLMFAGAWWVTVLPGLVLIGVLISVNVLGDALRDWLDPRARPR